MTSADGAAVRALLLLLDCCCRVGVAGGAAQQVVPALFGDSLTHTALHGVGQRKFLLAGVGPLGCIPNLRASGVAPPGRCIHQVNRIVGLLNQELGSLVDQLNVDHLGAISCAAIEDTLNNPNKYVDAVLLWVGAGVQDSGQITSLPYAKPCDNHPTQAVNLILAQRAFHSTQADAYPVNLALSKKHA